MPITTSQLGRWTIIAGMHPTAGVAIVVVASGMAVIVGGWLRTTLPPLATDALMALSGALIAVGGLLMIDDVNTASWIAGPVMLAVIAVVNVRALFARGGPFRT
jgi:hypothetical protein